VIPAKEYQKICQIGFSGPIPVAEPTLALAAFAEESIPYGRPNRTVLLERPFRDAAFTRVVRNAYESTCAMTGLKLINGGGRCEIEAAHIWPVEKEGPDSPRNGVALSRTVHWMFDRGFLSISDNGEILMAKRFIPEPVRRLLNPDGRVKWPATPSLTPHPIFLSYHRDVIFKGE
jgi:putative restriction endonuclease